jgi:hypothetical protein
LVPPLNWAKFQLLDGEAQEQLALLLREILFGVVREWDDQPNANTGKELFDDGEPSTSGRRLHSTALNLDLYLGRRTKPVLSMLVTNEKSPVTVHHPVEALARIDRCLCGEGDYGIHFEHTLVFVARSPFCSRRCAQGLKLTPSPSGGGVCHFIALGTSP